ncbi:hypothetical protein LEN_0880 [Lysobacter enzymogenes]|uniref:Thiolase C-terminal domain-containing protein n=1 Tax=Lysobacter enzymogenes TaxID=69 RepID=A0AAU9AC31_LYSEN|nr:hypothetical protein LEN_0880 [Lysobacter enzymogenes]
MARIMREAMGIALQRCAAGGSGVRGLALVGGPSGPTLLCQIVAT